MTPLTHKSHIRSYAVQGFAEETDLGDQDKTSRLNPASTYASLLPTATHSTSTGLTYLPRIHTYIEIHISPPCSNPRSAPPPPAGRFLLWSSSEPFPLAPPPSLSGNSPAKRLGAPVGAPVQPISPELRAAAGSAGSRYRRRELLRDGLRSRTYPKAPGASRLPARGPTKSSFIDPRLGPEQPQSQPGSRSLGKSLALPGNLRRARHPGTSCGQIRIHPCPYIVVAARKQVSVHVKGRLDFGVPHDHLNRFRVRPEGVAALMECGGVGGFDSDATPWPPSAHSSETDSGAEKVRSKPGTGPPSTWRRPNGPRWPGSSRSASPSTGRAQPCPGGRDPRRRRRASSPRPPPRPKGLSAVRGAEGVGSVRGGAGRKTGRSV